MMNRKRSTGFVLILFMMILFITGCKDKVEIEDRDFILALGVAVENGEFKLMYARPDLGVITGQTAKEGESFILTLKGQSFTKAEDNYSLEGNKRLDYSHLKAIILDESIMNDQDKMTEFLRCVENNYEISRNTLVFMTSDGVDKVLELNQTISGSIGEYLESLNKNNLSRKGVENQTIANLINGMNFQDKTAFVPMIAIVEERMAIHGAGIFFDNSLKDKITEEDYEFVTIAEGHGEDTSLEIEDGQYIKLKEVKRADRFSMRNGKPNLQIRIYGNAVFVEGGHVEGEVEEKASVLIRDRIMRNFVKYMKEDKLDFLNLYRLTAIQDRDIWKTYQGQQEKFINDLDIGVVVEVKMK